MAKPRAMTPQEFAPSYAKAKLEHPNWGQRRLAKVMGIAYNTLRKYLADPEYMAQLSPTVPGIILPQPAAVNEPSAQLDTAQQEFRADQTLDIAYKLTAKTIQDHIKRGRYDDARRVAIEGLKIASTEMDIKRAFAAVQVNIDNRKVNIHQEIVDSQEWVQLRGFIQAWMMDNLTEAQLEDFRAKGRERFGRFMNGN